MKKGQISYKLYFIADPEISNNRDIIQISEQAIQYGIDTIQLRSKNMDSYDFYFLADKLRNLTHKYRIPFIINDRIDIALAVDADGVHLGQRDLPAHIALKLIGRGKILGITADTYAELERAISDGADYVGYGPVFPTKSKLDTRESMVGIARLKDFCKKSSIPVVAIGGINVSNARQCIDAGAAGVSVISAIGLAEDIKIAVEKLKMAVK